MLIGVPKEIKDNEYRVGLTPESVSEVISHGHEALVEAGAGSGIGALDDDYQEAGAEVVETAEEIYARADMVVKVKEPQANERAMLRENQILYTYLHLAPDPEQTTALLNSGAVCIAYETVTDNSGRLPLLKPMSQVAGRMSIQAGAHALEKEAGGRGVLLGGVPGVAPGKVLIIGGGVVGFNAAQIATGLKAEVTIVDRDPSVLEYLSLHFESRVKTIHSTRTNLVNLLADTDLVIGGVLVPGASAPKLVRRDMLKTMQAGSVLVDVAIDQGGCFETSKPTTHSDPTYTVDGIVHYCVTNMPGAVARTSTYALNNVTLSHAITIADRGWKQALRDDPNLRNGLNVCAGKVTYQAVANDQGHHFCPPMRMLGA